MVLWTKVALPGGGGSPGAGPFSIDTYRLEVLNKTQVSYPVSIGPLLLCQYLIMINVVSI